MLVHCRQIPSGATVTYPLMVDNLDDSGESAGVGVVAVDEHDAANLNEAPVGSLNDCFAHGDGGLPRVSELPDLSDTQMSLANAG